MSVCVCLCLVPSKPDDLIYLNSTESTMMLSWKQTGVADNYTVQYNDTDTSSVDMTRVSSNDSVTVTMTVSDLPTPGDYYCITVTAVSANLLYSDTATLCNYTGEQLSKCMYHIISYHNIVLKQQNRLKVGTDMPKLKVKMQSVSDDMSGNEFLKSHVLSWQ